MPLKYNSVEFTHKRGKDFCKVSFNQIETTGNALEHYPAEYTKKSTQPINKLMSDTKFRLEAHLMFASELIDGSIDLDENLDYEKYFETQAHQKDDRFNGVEVTKVEFIANKEGELASVKITGKKVTQLTDKPFANTIKTPVIQLNKDSDNYYKLVTILDGQISDLIKSLDDYCEKARVMANSQLKIA